MEGGVIDIVERLRKHVNDRGGASLENGAWSMMLKGADEIERLRQYISELEDAIASNNPTEIFNKSARLEGLLTALKEKA